MDNLNIEEKLYNFYNFNKENFQISDECGQRLRSISINTKHTKVWSRILISYGIIILLLIIMVPASAYGTITISDIVYDKLKNVGLSEEQMIEIEHGLKDAGFSDEKIKAFTPLEVNEYGQTYGLDALGADLIAVTSDEGLDGYVYRDELYGDIGINTPEEALEWQNSKTENRSFTVYESDGKTAIGKFTLRGE